MIICAAFYFVPGPAVRGEYPAFGPFFDEESFFVEKKIVRREMEV